MKPLEFFTSRIGKRIYRDNVKFCDCENCKEGNNGIVISDENHARHLFEFQLDMYHEGVDLNYRDEK